MTTDEAIAELSRLRNLCISKPDKEKRAPNPGERRLFDALQVALRALDQAKGTS